MIALCDKCGKVTKIKYVLTNHPKGIQETYFKCEQCEKRYTCFVTDKRVQLQEEVNERMAKLKHELEST